MIVRKANINLNKRNESKIIACLKIIINFSVDWKDEWEKRANERARDIVARECVCTRLNGSNWNWNWNILFEKVVCSSRPLDVGFFLFGCSAREWGDTYTIREFLFCAFDLVSIWCWMFLGPPSAFNFDFPYSIKLAFQRYFRIRSVRHLRDEKMRWEVERNLINHSDN